MRLAVSAAVGVPLFRYLRPIPLLMSVVFRNLPARCTTRARMLVARCRCAVSARCAKVSVSPLFRRTHVSKTMEGRTVLFKNERLAIVSAHPCVQNHGETYSFVQKRASRHCFGAPMCPKPWRNVQFCSKTSVSPWFRHTHVSKTVVKRSLLFKTVKQLLLFGVAAAGPS